jgi:hypothetical protein
MAVSAARAIPPFPRVLHPHLGRGRFGRGRAQAPKDWTAHRLVRSRQNRHPAPRTLEEPARFAVRWHVRPGSLMTGLRSRSPPTESPSPVLSLGGYLRPRRTPFRSWCLARAYDRALELREHPEHLAERFARRRHRALKIMILRFKNGCVMLFIC